MSGAASKRTPITRGKPLPTIAQLVAQVAALQKRLTVSEARTDGLDQFLGEWPYRYCPRPAGEPVDTRLDDEAS